MSMTRRALFDAAAAATAVIGSAMIAGCPSFAAAQLTKDQAQYREQPNGGQQCSQCTNYLAPSGCRLVSGAVTPTGWCSLFQKKNA